MMTRDTAELYGLRDRGRIAPGYRADINIIDYDRLDLLLPYMVWDLPTGARRVMQRASGYVATFVAGIRTIAKDEATGALPGRLIRGTSAAISIDKANWGLNLDDCDLSLNHIIGCSARLIPWSRNPVAALGAHTESLLVLVKGLQFQKHTH